jgi:hypothetical protein
MIQGTLANSCAGDRYEYPAIVVDEMWVSVLHDGQYRLHPSRWAGIIDTGASRSAIPADICRRLGIRKPETHRTVQSVDRRPNLPKSPHYFVKIHLPGIGEAKVLAASVSRSSIILGRDFLAELGLTLVMDSASRKWSLGRLGPQRVGGRRDSLDSNERARNDQNRTFPCDKPLCGH